MGGRNSEHIKEKLAEKSKFKQGSKPGVIGGSWETGRGSELGIKERGKGWFGRSRVWRGEKERESRTVVFMLGKSGSSCTKSRLGGGHDSNSHWKESERWGKDLVNLSGVRGGVLRGG